MHMLRCEDDKLRFVLDLREAQRAYIQKGLGYKRKTIKRKDAFLRFCLWKSCISPLQTKLQNLRRLVICNGDSWAQFSAEKVISFLPTLWFYPFFREKRFGKHIYLKRNPQTIENKDFLAIISITATRHKTVTPKVWPFCGCGKAAAKVSGL